MHPTATGELAAVFQQAAEKSSESLSHWLGRPTTITVRDVAQFPIEQAAVMLGTGAETLCVCAMHVGSHTPGILALALSDESGFALADMLLGRQEGASKEWGEIERSATAETTNIIGCAYLNALASAAGAGGDGPVLIPSPPWFIRDYAEAVMGSLIVAQKSDAAGVFLTRTVFAIEGTPIRCSLLFVPESIAAGAPGGGGVP